MAARRSALVLSPESPYPPFGGGALRTASLLNYLARNFDVDLIVFRHRPDQDPASALPPGLARSVQVIDLPVHGRGLASKVLRNTRRALQGIPPLVDRFRGYGSALRLGRRYDLAVIEHFWCAEYVEDLAKVSDAVVLNLHNVESSLHRTCAAADPFPGSLAHRFFGYRSEQMERQWLPRFTAILASSEADAARVRRIPGAPEVMVYPNSIPFRPPVETVEEDVIAFSGNLEYHPNRTAVQFFATRVWPELSARHPGLKWRLIGMNPWAIEPEIRGLDRVETTGAVPDSVPLLAAAKVVVAPLLSGSGTRLKIIEAWAAGRAVVSTSIGAEGLPITNAVNIAIADHPADFVESIDKLLLSPELRRNLGRAGRCLYEQDLTWESAWRSLNCNLGWKFK